MENNMQSKRGGGLGIKHINLFKMTLLGKWRQ